MRLDLPIDSTLSDLALALRQAGGRAVLVGGIVRDHLLRRPSKDYDVEVYGLGLQQLDQELSRFGEVIAIGRAFGVLRVKGIDADFSIPRRDSKRGPGHRGFLAELDPTLDFAAAARRRDLTINSLGVDPLTGELLDPFGGVKDLERGVLRATDPGQFSEDPLRGLRVAQFTARLEMEPDAELRALCSSLDLAELPGERLFEEFRKLLLKARRPSLGLEFLRQTSLLRPFPELQAMVSTPQDPHWHPEGTVWQHTLLVLDEAAAKRIGDDGEDLALMFGALAHDIGKPATTIEAGGRIRSPRHDEDGVSISAALMNRLSASNRLTQQVGALVRFHLAPALLPGQKATAKAYRRLARKLAEVSVGFDLLHRLAAADHLGRTTADALARIFPAGDEFRRQMENLPQGKQAVQDVVLGRHLISRGMTPGPEFGVWLAACRDVQDETGWQDPDRILDRVLSR